MENRLQAVREAFDAVCELPAEARMPALDALGIAPDVREEVLRLLAADDGAGGFLDTPAADLTSLRSWAEVGPSAEADPLVGFTLGGYRITGTLGSGGMGVVYRAEQSNPRRLVALKVIRAAFAGRELMRRFSHEAAALGRLRHPCVAQIHEARTAAGPDGRDIAFLAMEFVNGESLLEFVERAGLGNAGRLSLFAKICDGVEHAHQKGVVHRDLKPGNIVVEDGLSEGASSTRAEAGPTPKILDFGVARLTDSDLAVTTMSTSVGQVLGTLAYMSPEQVRGDVGSVDTRSDVYSLGVILCELMTGVLPYAIRGKPLAEAARIISADEPTLAGANARTLRGDIETIILRALEKEPERRYQSAAELAADVRRHLADLPIVARPATTAYQLKKFVRRNKVLVGGVACVFVALVLGIVGTGFGLVRAQRAEAAEALKAAEARTEARRAQRTLQFVKRVLMSSDQRNTGGKNLTMRELLDQLAARSEAELADDPVVAGAIYDTIAGSYLAIGELDAAERFVERSERLRGEGTTASGGEQARSLLGRGNLERRRGDLAAATADVARAVEALESAGEAGRADLPEALGALAEIRLAANDATGAEQHARRAIGLLGERSDETVLRLELQSVLGDILWLKGEPAEAEALLRKTLEEQASYFGREHPDVAFTQLAMARMLQHAGRADESIEFFRAADATFKKVYPSTSRYSGLAASSLAFALMSSKRLDEAEAIASEDMRRREAEGPGSEPELLRAVSLCAAIASTRQDLPAEEPLRRRQVELARAIHGNDHLAAQQAELALAKCLLDAGKVDEAGVLLAPVLEPVPQRKTDFTRVEAVLLAARWQEAREDYEGARATYLGLQASAERDGASATSRLNIARRFAAMLVRRHDVEGAERVLVDLRNSLAASLGDDNRIVKMADREIESVRARRGNPLPGSTDKAP